MNSLVHAQLLLGITLVGATYADLAPPGDFICFDRNQNMVQVEFNDDQHVNFVIQNDEKTTFSGIGTKTLDVQPGVNIRTYHNLVDESGDLFPHLSKVKISVSKDNTAVEKVETTDELGNLIRTYSECRLYDLES